MVIVTDRKSPNVHKDVLEEMEFEFSRCLNIMESTEDNKTMKENGELSIKGKIKEGDN